MIQAPSNSPPFATSSPRMSAARSTAEINLSGGGTPWDVCFAGREDLSDAITFGRGVPDVGFPGASAYTVTMYPLDGALKFRDTRTLAIRKRNRAGRMANVNVVAVASVMVRREEYEILRHEENGDSWITLFRLRPGCGFIVQQMPITPPLYTSTPAPLNHGMLRLWNRRLEVQSKTHLAIVVRNHRTYNPWAIVLRNEVLGLMAPTQAVAPATPQSTGLAAGQPRSDPAPPTADDDLIDLYSDESPAAGAASGTRRQVPKLPTSLLPSRKPEGQASSPAPQSASPVWATEGPSSDPFEGLWEQARDSTRSGKGKGKGKEKEF